MCCYILALKILKQEDYCKFEVCLDYIVNSGHLRLYSQTLPKKKKIIKEKEGRKRGRKEKRNIGMCNLNGTPKKLLRISKQFLITSSNNYTMITKYLPSINRLL